MDRAGTALGARSPDRDEIRREGLRSIIAARRDHGRRGVISLHRTAWAGTTGILISLVLVATIRAQVPESSGAGPRRDRATLLAGCGPDEPPGLVADDAPLQRPAPLDPAVMAARSTIPVQGPEQAGTAVGPDPSPADDPLPGVAPLPAVAQANPPAAGQANPPTGAAGRAQPGAANRPAPPAAQVPAGPQRQTPPAECSGGEPTGRRRVPAGAVQPGRPGHDAYQRAGRAPAPRAAQPSQRDEYPRLAQGHRHDHRQLRGRHRREGAQRHHQARQPGGQAGRVDPLHLHEGRAPGRGRVRQERDASSPRSTSSATSGRTRSWA